MATSRNDSQTTPSGDTQESHMQAMLSGKTEESHGLDLDRETSSSSTEDYEKTESKLEHDNHSPLEEHESEPLPYPTALSAATTRRSYTPRTRSRLGSLAPGFTAALGEENFDRETELEMQRSKTQRNLEQGKPDDPNLVEWDGPDDPGMPMNWPTWKKWVVTISIGMTTLMATFASSVFSVAIVPVSKLYGVSTEVTTLGVSLFVLGFAWGPIVWGPLSEVYGRKVPLFTGFFIFTIFNIPVAVAQNLYTIMISRFIGGFAASAPLVIGGGMLADFWDPVMRGVAMPFFAGATFIGPSLAPILGGFITQSHLGWRWTAYLTLIMACFFGIIGFVVVPESFGPAILQRRAKRIRYETQNWAIHAKADEKEINLKEIITKYLIRPFVMLAFEPILMLLTIYMSLIYGIIYLFFEVFPITFQEQRGWNQGVGALPFLSLMVGVVMGCALCAYLAKTRYARKFKQAGRVAPEERLIPMIIGGALLPAGLFWYVRRSFDLVRCD